MLTDIKNFKKILKIYFLRLFQPTTLFYVMFSFLSFCILPAYKIILILLLINLSLPFLRIAYDMYITYSGRLYIENKGCHIASPILGVINLKNLKLLYAEEESLFYFIYDKNWGYGAIPLVFSSKLNAELFLNELRKKVTFIDELSAKRVSFYKSGKYSKLKRD